MTIDRPKLEELKKAMSSAVLPSGDVPAAEDIVEDEGPRRRKGLVPDMVDGDQELLRMLAVWRFASPIALGALAWPERTPAGREWRMRQLVNCEILGRRRLRFATTRHVVWARHRARTVPLLPPPPTPLQPPRFNEDAARHGWMRSTVVAAYRAAGWKPVARSDIDKIPTIMGIPPEYAARVWGKAAPSFPFEIFSKRRPSDKAHVFHIIVVDDRETAIDRIIDLLPVKAEGRSSRIAVRFFPCDDFTLWSPKDQRYYFEEARVLRMRESLKNAGLLDIPATNVGPEVPAWRTKKVSL